MTALEGAKNRCLINYSWRSSTALLGNFLQIGGSAHGPIPWLHSQKISVYFHDFNESYFLHKLKKYNFQKKHFETFSRRSLIKTPKRQPYLAEMSKTTNLKAKYKPSASDFKLSKLFKVFQSHNKCHSCKCNSCKCMSEMLYVTTPFLITCGLQTNDSFQK